MKPLTPSDPETKSVDVLAGNVAALQALLPEAFTEGKIDFEVLKQLLGGTVEEREEKYGLNWHGKRRARQIALTPSTGTLRPCPEESVDWDTTQNLMIEGDNLEVLKLLQKSYAGKVKLIYIDPPYNTGGDFLYPDDFRDNIGNYLIRTGQAESDGRKNTSNTEASGRYHTDWLNMMYPRLKLARNLLRDDGVAVLHMDEHEHANTAEILAEIFGEENVLGAAVWDKRNPKGDATRLAYQHETLFFVAKDHGAFARGDGLIRRKRNAEAMLAKAGALFTRIGKRDLPADLKEAARRYGLSGAAVTKHERLIDLTDVNREFVDWIRGQDFSGGESAYSKIDEQGNVYRLVSMAWPNKKKAPDEYFIPLKHPVTGKDCPVPERGWRNPPDTMKRLLEAGQIVFGADHSVQPQRKYLLRENLTENFPSILAYGGSDDALLADLGVPFDNPKPVEVARQLVSSVLTGDGIVLDFFAGSGTAGHAVMEQNAMTGSTLRYILVQLPEVLDASDKAQAPAARFCDSLKRPRTLAEITKERLRRAAVRIRGAGSLVSGDLGFRVFKLASSNIQAWEPDRANLAKTLEEAVDHLKTDRTEQDILFEVLLKLGLDLTVPIEKKTIAGKDVHSVGAGTLIVCLAESVAAKDVEPLALGIAEWHKAQRPAGESTVVFRDSAFADDVAKSNLTAILQQHGLEDVRSL